MKQVLIAVAVFVGLLGVVLAMRDRGNVNVGVPKLVLPKVDETKITSVEVSGAQTVTLKKEADGWKVAGPSKAFHPADEGQVNALREGLSRLAATDFVTDRPGRFTELELDDAKGLRVKVFTDGAAPALDVVLGKAGKSGGTYLRAPTGDAVFLTQSSVVYSLRTDANGWRKKAIFPATLDQFSKVTMKLGAGDTFELESKPDGTWGLVTAAPAGFRFSADVAAQWVVTVASTTAVDFADAPSDEPLTVATIEVQLKDGKKAVMRLGAPNADRVPVRIDGDPQRYLVAVDHATRVTKRLDDLRDTHPLSFDPNKAQKLLIQAGVKKTVLVREAGTWRLLEPKVLPPARTARRH